MFSNTNLPISLPVSGYYLAFYNVINATDRGRIALFVFFVQTTDDIRLFFLTLGC